MKLCVLLPLLASLALAQTDTGQVRRVLEPALVAPDVVALQLRDYLARKVPPLRAPSSAEQWTSEAARLRRHVLDDVVFHGWPRAWIEAPPRFEDLGPVPSGPGYRMRKLRYEIVPGFYSTAILYEPEKTAGKAPAILNVNGHVGAPGKAVEYKQKRCIDQALEGIVALNLEWIGMGELSQHDNAHWFGAHLELAGAGVDGLFYLAMRRGLDYLEQLPQVDRTRLGVTGLSGGGWQTIVLSALDTRVAAAVPVAGYSALLSRIERTMDVGDIEQNPTDLYVGQDWPHLTAMRAPRPTLLVYNAEDDCCFRAPQVKPYIFDAVRPFFRLYGSEDRLAWHENTDPSTHNYQLDNRMAAYRFFARAFGLAEPKAEVAPAEQIKSVEELRVGLPPDNLTILGLARKMAAEIRRPEADRARLREVVRYRNVAVRHAWALDNSKNRGLETRSYRFDFGNGLSAAAVWLKAISAAESPAATIVLDDKGKKAAAAAVSDRVNRGERVLAVDLLFTGDASPRRPAGFTQMLAGSGDRPLGMEAAQLIALARWMGGKARVETSGIRSQAVARVAAALEPGAFGAVVTREGMTSFQHLFDAPVEYEAAPDLFCLDLYKEFDLDGLAKLAER